MTEIYADMAKVVKVLDDYSVVINRGGRDGVAHGDRYLIFYLGDELIDPDSQENLGRLEIVRGRAKVTHLQEAMATLTSIETRVVSGRKILRSPGNALRGFAGLFGHEEVYEEPETVDVELAAKQGDLAKKI